MPVLVEHVHQDVEWGLVDAVPADGEADLRHRGPQRRLRDVRLRHRHPDVLYSSSVQYLNYLIFSEKSQRFEFKCEVSLGRNKCDVVVNLRAVTGGWQEADPLLGVHVPGDVGPHSDGRHRAPGQCVLSIQLPFHPQCHSVQSLESC